MTCFKYWPHSTLGPLGVLLERIKLSERLSTRLRDSLLELRLKNINEELIEKGGQCAHRDTRVMRDNVSQSLQEGQRRWEERANVEDVGIHKKLMARNRTVSGDLGVIMRDTRPPL